MRALARAGHDHDDGPTAAQALALRRRSRSTWCSSTSRCPTGMDATVVGALHRYAGRRRHADRARQQPTATLARRRRRLRRQAVQRRGGDRARARGAAAAGEPRTGGFGRSCGRARSSSTRCCRARLNGEELQLPQGDRPARAADARRRPRRPARGADDATCGSQTASRLARRSTCTSARCVASSATTRPRRASSTRCAASASASALSPSCSTRTADGR